MTFTGISLAALDFYEGLEADNSKAYWTAHKQVYEESVRAPLEALCSRWSPVRGGQAVPPLPRRAVQQGQDAVQDAPGRVVR